MMWSKKALTQIKKARETWEKTTLKESLQRSPEREIFSELPKKRIYTPEDVSHSDYIRDLGFPGEYPYIRGVHPTMYRSRLWGMAEYSGFGMPEDTNKRWKVLLEQGQTGVSLACDLPTQLGYDPDYPLAESEIGVVGVSCPSLKEAELLFDGIPLDKITIRGSISHSHMVLWAMFISIAEKQGVPPEKVGGSVHWDCLGEYLGRGAYIFPPEGAMRLYLDFLEFGLKHMPKVSYHVNAYTVRESGATLVQEAAYALAAGSAYIQAAIDRGMHLDGIASRLSFNLAIHMNLFEEAAKFRAMRRLWARIMKERFGATKESSLQFRFGPGTGGSTFTAQEPENNIVRGTIESLEAIMGGATYLHTASYDEALAIPTEKAVTIALKTQLIIGHESGITEVVDPLGGSYYVEGLTDEIETKVTDYMHEIEQKGGIFEVVKSGWFQSRVAQAAYQKQKQIAEGKRVVVGVNRFVSDEKSHYEIHRADPRVTEEMKRRIKLLREERDDGRVQKALSELQVAAEGKENLVPFVIQAIKAYATIGDICGVLRKVFGEYVGPTF